MATNLDKMRERLNKLHSNERGEKKEDPNFWKLPKVEEGPKLVRILPDKAGGDPFRELKIHYDLGKVQFRSLSDAGEKNDPVNDAMQLAWADWRKEKEANNKEGQDKIWNTLIKKMKPQPRFFVQVLVRGEEEKGARVWGLSKTHYQELLEKFLDPDYGDLADPDGGHDISVTPKKVNKPLGNGKVIEVEYSVSVKPKPSKLLPSKKDVDALLASQPDIDDILEERFLKSRQEVEQIVEDFLSSVDGANNLQEVDDKDENEEALEKLLES